MTENPVSKEQWDWFNHLPIEPMKDGYIRTCQCTGQFRFRAGVTDGEDIAVWIHRHFDCEEKVPLTNPVPLPTIHDLYDFERFIKFTAAGLAAFINEYELRRLPISNKDTQYFLDPNGNRFAFAKSKLNQFPELDYVLLPDQTEVRK